MPKSRILAHTMLIIMAHRANAIVIGSTLKNAVADRTLKSVGMNDDGWLNGSNRIGAKSKLFDDWSGSEAIEAWAALLL